MSGAHNDLQASRIVDGRHYFQSEEEITFSKEATIFEVLNGARTIIIEVGSEMLPLEYL